MPGHPSSGGVALSAVLEDGAWHHWDEVLRLASKRVPPLTAKEAAMYVHGRKGGRRVHPMPDSYLINYGSKCVIRTGINAARRSGWIEQKRDESGDRWLRMASRPWWMDKS
jgi:hypothetical protein